VLQNYFKQSSIILFVCATERNIPTDKTFILQVKKLQLFITINGKKERR